MKQKERFYVFISVAGRTVCENKYGYKTYREAKEKAAIWQNDGFEVGITKI